MFKARLFGIEHKMSQERAEQLRSGEKARCQAEVIWGTGASGRNAHVDPVFLPVIGKNNEVAFLERCHRR